MPITGIVHHPSRLVVFALHGHITYAQAAAAFASFARTADHKADYNEIAPIHPGATFDTDLLQDMYRLVDLTKAHLEDPKKWYPAVAFLCEAQQRSSLVELYAVIGESRSDIGRRYAFFGDVDSAATWVERRPADLRAALAEVGAEHEALAWMTQEFP